MKQHPFAPSPDRRSALWRVAAGILAAVVLYALWSLRPPPETVIRTVASICTGDYRQARTQSDTADVDRRTYQVSRRYMWRLPSCGNLRKAGRIS